MVGLCPLLPSPGGTGQRCWVAASHPAMALRGLCPHGAPWRGAGGSEGRPQPSWAWRANATSLLGDAKVGTAVCPHAWEHAWPAPPSTAAAPGNPQNVCRGVQGAGGMAGVAVAGGTRGAGRSRRVGAPQPPALPPRSPLQGGFYLADFVFRRREPELSRALVPSGLSRGSVSHRRGAVAPRCACGGGGTPGLLGPLQLSDPNTGLCRAGSSISATGTHRGGDGITGGRGTPLPWRLWGASSRRCCRAVVPHKGQFCPCCVQLGAGKVLITPLHG